MIRRSLILLICVFVWQLSFYILPLQAQPVRALTVDFKDGQPFTSDSNIALRNIPAIIPANRTASGPQNTFTVLGAIPLTITTVDATCKENNGQILVQASGGTAPYTYKLSNGWVLQTGNFVFVPEGNYTVTVTDRMGEIATANVTVANHFLPPKLRYTEFASPSVLNCNGATAKLSLEAYEGTPPYRYTLDKINYQSSGVFNNLHAGTYQYIVEDANGCTASSWELVRAVNCPMALVFTYSGSACNSDGHIYADPTPFFVYSLDGINYQTSPDFDNVSSGVKVIYYKNVNTGDVRTFALSILQECHVRIDFVTEDAACGQDDGKLTIIASNGTPPYSYTIDGINYQSSNVFTGLAPGTYMATVKDAAGFTSSWGTIVHDRCPVVTAVSTHDNCNLSTGTITATPDKGTAPYEYSIDGTNFQNSNVFTGLAAGNYTVTLKDALGFTATTTIEVKAYCLNVTAVATHVVCSNTNGTITATGSSGSPPYRYSIDGSNFQNSNVFSGLPAGQYTVTIKDNLGQTATTNVQITDTPGPQITVGNTPALCAGNNGTITITGSAGTAALQYSINGTNYQSSNLFNGIAPGSYTAYVKDANGCIASSPVTVSLNCPMITATVTNETCGNSNGSVRVTVTNNPDFGLYQYSIDGNNFQSSNLLNGLAAGNYTVTVKDALGYLHTKSVSIANNCPVVTVSVTNETCSNANGVITASGSNGIAPYEFSIDGTSYKSSTVFNGLSAGNYTVYIRDAGGSVQSTGATITNITGPQLSIQSVTEATCINNDGGLSLSASGGTSPFQYSLDGNSFQSSNSFTNKASGAYTGWVKDANGCIASQQAVIGLSDNLTVQAGNDLTICEGDKVVLPATSNGNDFVWSPSVTLNNPALFHPTASPSTTTKYYVTARLGVCTKIDSLIVSVNPAPVANAGKDSVICYGKDIQLTGSGGVKYEWSPSTYLNDVTIADPVLTNPTSTITYSLYVTDNNGCRSLQPDMVKITVTPPAKVFAGNDTAIVMNQPFILKATDINNSGFTQYEWSPSYGLNSTNLQNPTTILDRDMTYTLTATTGSGCKGVDEVTIKVYKGPEIYVPTAFTPNNDGRNDILKAIPVGIKEFRYFAVFNRWGQRVFYTNDANRGWNGKIGSAEQGNDSFTWMAEGIDDAGKKVVRKGTVVIVR